MWWIERMLLVYWDFTNIMMRALPSTILSCSFGPTIMDNASHRSSLLKPVASSSLQIHLADLEGARLAIQDPQRRELAGLLRDMRQIKQKYFQAWISGAPTMILKEISKYDGLLCMLQASCYDESVSTVALCSMLVTKIFAHEHESHCMVTCLQVPPKLRLEMQDQLAADRVNFEGYLSRSRELCTMVLGSSSVAASKLAPQLID